MFGVWCRNCQISRRTSLSVVCVGVQFGLGWVFLGWVFVVVVDEVFLRPAFTLLLPSVEL